MPTDRAAWTPAMRSLLVGRDLLTLGIARDDAQHWLLGRRWVAGATRQEGVRLERLTRCGRAAVRLRATRDRAQVSCGDCLAALGEEDTVG